MQTRRITSLVNPAAPSRSGRRTLKGLAVCLFFLISLAQAVEAQHMVKATMPIKGGVKPSARLQTRSLQPAAAAAATPYPLTSTFKLHSRPSASKKIYLDFNGHVTQNTPWNSNAVPKIWTISYSLDTDSSAFSDAELTEIQGMWQRVAEAYSPFHVDVTTEEPSVADLIDTGAGDSRWGIRVLIGVSTPSPAAGAGGVAFVGAFGADVGTGQDVPCFAFSDAQGNDSFVISLTCIHEAGHTLGLSHDGPGYYGGHGSGATGWAPFMGAGFDKQLQQWSKGEYVGADNFEDDLAIITTQNGFSYRADDHANNKTTARTIAGTSASGAFNISQSGVIEQRTDTDWFKLVAKTGPVSLNAVGSPLMPMLDIQMDLYDANGKLLVSSNPVDELTAAISTTVTGGTYYVRIDGVGKGDLATGYTDYSSLGQYTITGTYSNATSPSPTTNVLASYNAGSKTLTITGDKGNNSVSIIRSGLNLKVEGGASTTINSKTAVVYPLAAGTTVITLNADLKEGNDIFALDSVQLLNATINLGAGADNLTVKNSPAVVMAINADTTAANVSGADTVVLQSSNVSNTLNCNLGAFNDKFSLSSCVVNIMNLQMGAGDDASTLAFSTLKSLVVDGGAGTDTLIRTTSTVTNPPTITNVP